MKDVLLPNTVSQRDNEKPHTAELDDIATPHISKSKLPTYRRLKKSSIRQYRKPLSPLEGSKSVQCRLTARRAVCMPR